MEIQRIADLWQQLRATIGEVVLDQEESSRLLLIALLSRGHVLLEGLPGTGKTLLARTFSRCLQLDFKRIQFTPDLMPGDVVGTNLFNFQTNEFRLTRGPLFTEFLLADEINRTPPKTQSALLEAMQERSVTIDGTSHELSPGFMVVATQNPIEHEGTYPLPEAQLDRFLFKLEIGYPQRDLEVAMVQIHGGRDSGQQEIGADATIADLATIQAARETVAQLHLADELVAYVVDLVRATRDQPALQFGASPRTANMLAMAARAAAVLEGRDFVIPDDIKGLLNPVMRHRLVLSPTAEVEGSSIDQVLASIIDTVAAPR